MMDGRWMGDEDGMWMGGGWAVDGWMAQCGWRRRSLLAPVGKTYNSLLEGEKKM